MRLEQLAEQTVTANERIRQSEETRRDCEQKVSSLRSQSRELSARKETHAREAAVWTNGSRQRAASGIRWSSSCGRAMSSPPPWQCSRCPHPRTRRRPSAV